MAATYLLFLNTSQRPASRYITDKPKNYFMNFELEIFFLMNNKMEYPSWNTKLKYKVLCDRNYEN